MITLEQIKTQAIDVQDAKTVLDFAEKEAIEASNYVEQRKQTLKEEEVILETMQNEFIDENIDKLEQYHADNIDEGSSNGEIQQANFEKWLENTPFEELVAIIEK